MIYTQLSPKMTEVEGLLSLQHGLPMGHIVSLIIILRAQVEQQTKIPNPPIHHFALSAPGEEITNSCATGS